MNNKIIYCIGGANIDYKFKTQSPLVFASSYSVKPYKTLGGVARNVADNLANFTHNIYFQSVVGNVALIKNNVLLGAQLARDLFF